jgi:hypothetical protein
MIKIRKINVEPTAVYDISVPETECFFADNILVHNCEILLPTVAMGTTKKKFIKVKKEVASDFLLNKPEQFVKLKKLK